MKTQNIRLKPAGPGITPTSAGLLIRLNTYRLAVLALFFAGATLLSTSAASADTITVVNTNDSGPGSLRQALVDANDGDTINFYSSLTGQRITLTSGQLNVDKDVTVSGPGAKNLAVDGNRLSRVFYVNPDKTVTIDGLTVANGYSQLYGGGILNEGAALTVTNCKLSGNGAYGGGGIYNDAAAMTITNCMLSGNGAGSGGGGGIYNNAGVLTVTNCKLSGNGGNGGGGILNEDGAMKASNCTFSGNHAYGGGGVVFNFASSDAATLTVTNCTISGNTVGKGEGGGILNIAFGGGARLTITNTTISGNSAGGGGGIHSEAHNATVAEVETGNTIFDAGSLGENIYNYAGTVTSLGYNVSSDNGSGYLIGPGDKINTDPVLGPLQDNGGPTFTHALLPNSPAINAGDPSFTPPPAYDQRGPGFDRVVNGRIDVGSFEIQSAPTPTPRPWSTPRPRLTPRPRP